jgi:hypothetical protein
MSSEHSAAPPTVIKLATQERGQQRCTLGQIDLNGFAWLVGNFAFGQLCQCQLHTVLVDRYHVAFA